MVDGPNEINKVPVYYWGWWGGVQTIDYTPSISVCDLMLWSDNNVCIWMLNKYFKF